MEVSDISSGKLTTTVAYRFTTGSNSNNIALSPDQKFVYLSYTYSGSVAALFFDSSTGVLSGGGCTSKVLKGFAGDLGQVAVAPSKSGSGFAYVAESPGNIGTLRLTSNGTNCILAEVAGSPTPDPQSLSLLSLQMYFE